MFIAWFSGKYLFSHLNIKPCLQCTLMQPACKQIFSIFQNQRKEWHNKFIEKPPIGFYSGDRCYQISYLWFLHAMSLHIDIQELSLYIFHLPPTLGAHRIHWENSWQTLQWTVNWLQPHACFCLKPFSHNLLPFSSFGPMLSQFLPAGRSEVQRYYIQVFWYYFINCKENWSSIT